MKPLVSILIPCFNAEEFIADTIRSAIAQTWSRKEIIIVDDGSQDKTLAIARQFEAENVLVLTQDNQGAAAARNRSFAVSQGDYIQWLDADDLLAPDKISRQMAVLGPSQCKRLLVSSAWGRFFYRYNRTEWVPTALWCDLSPVEFLLRKMEHNLFMQTATWLVSRELTEAAGHWDTKLLGDDDGEYFCRILLKGQYIRFVPEARVYYRATSNSLSYIGRSNRKLEAQLHSMRLHIEYLRSMEDTTRARAACVKYLQTWLINFYPERPDLVEQMENIAGELGGRLKPPCLSWKYSWMRAILGWNVAKRCKLALPQFKWELLRLLDKTLFRMENYFYPQACGQSR